MDCEMCNEEIEGMCRGIYANNGDIEYTLLCKKCFDKIECELRGH